ncbi:MAG: FecR domain-containing protein [Gemmataceae bacterium]
MNPERLLELLDGYVENRLSDADRADLSAELARSPASCRAFWGYVHQHAMLSDLIAESAGIRLAHADAAPPARRSYPWAALAAGLLFAAGVGWLAWPRPDAPAATLAELRGDVRLRVGDDLVSAAPGQRLAAGTEVHTGGGSSVVVAYPDSSRLELTADTAVRLLEEVGVFLVRGEVNATVTSRPKSRPLTLRTEQGDVIASGARFRSANVDGETRVEVEEGRALLGPRGGRAIEQFTGAYALIAGPDPELYRAAPMPPLASAPARQIDEPTGPVMGLAVSPDGRTLAIPCWAGGVRLIDLHAPDRDRLLAGGDARPNAVAFSPDGQTLAVGYDPVKRTPTPLTVWDVRTGRTVHALRPVARKVHALAFAPDGRTLAFVSNAGNQRGVNVWDLGDTRERLRLAERADRVLCLAAHSAGRLVAAGTGDGSVVLGDPDTGRTVRTLDGHEREVQAVAFQPGGDLLATGGRDGVIKLWSVSTGALVRTLTGKFNEVRCLAFAPDGRTLASGHGGTAVLWDVDAGTRRSTFRAHRFAVTALAYLPDGRTLVSAGWDRCVKLWTLRPVDAQ